MIGRTQDAPLANAGQSGSWQRAKTRICLTPRRKEKRIRLQWRGRSLNRQVEAAHAYLPIQLMAARRQDWVKAARYSDLGGLQGASSPLGGEVVDDLCIVARGSSLSVGQHIHLSQMASHLDSRCRLACTTARKVVLDATSEWS